MMIEGMGGSRKDPKRGGYRWEDEAVRRGGCVCILEGSERDDCAL